MKAYFSRARTKRFFSIVLVTHAFVHTPCAHATVLISGNSTPPFTFVQSVTNAVFDRATETFFVGLSAGGGSYALSKITAHSTGTPAFTGIASANSLNNANIAFLALATNEGNPYPLLTTIRATGTTDRSIFALTPDGTTVRQSANILNANGTLTGAPAALAANRDFIFTAASPLSGNFGQPQSGIAVVSINRDMPSEDLSSITQTAAVAGDPSIVAKPLDLNSPELYIQNPVEMSSPTVMYWDDQLQRLYVGVSPTAGPLAYDGARSVVVARVNTQNPADYGTLELSEITPEGAITPEAFNDQSQIIVGIHDDLIGTMAWEPYHLAVLHASTGPSYLITNVATKTILGTDATTTTIANKIFALPLVDLRDENGDIASADEALHGTLANKNAALSSSFKFIVPATANGQLVSDPTISAPTDTFALVGGTPLVLPAEEHPSDIVVVGDTVYVSFDQSQTNDNETGIFYSQALFDNDGKIQGWTPWSKRGFPLIAFPNNVNTSRVSFFDVDAASGSVIAVGGDNQRTVSVNAWNLGTQGPSLTAQLNRTMCNGTYSVLDLDAFTRGFNGATGYRYALFGGSCRVAMALASQNRTGNLSLTPQIVPTDYREEENFLVTDLPEPGGCVTVLEYSRRGELADTDDTTFADLPNYFFAGTANGLFVFANPNKSGFGQSSLGYLNEPPLSTGQWFKAPNITGAIVDVKTIGNSLYVLTFTTSKTAFLKNVLYKIEFAPTINAMFNPSNITTIAQTDVDLFSGIFSFSGIRVVSTYPDNQTEQIALATNNGIFMSSRPGGVQGATNQTDAAWEQIGATDTVMYTGLASTDPFFNPEFAIQNPTTFWALSVQDQQTKKTFGRSSISQVSGVADSGPFALIPDPFNAKSTSPQFTSIPSSTFFWTDGARRFFIASRTQDTPSINRLMSMPYNVHEWDITNPNTTLLFNKTLDTHRAFYWIKEIGATGILMAGTSRGAVALE
jgi:hypothetical protein